MLFAEIDSSGEEYNVLRVEEGGRTIFQSPAVLPSFGSETSSSHGSPQVSSLESGSLSGRSTREDSIESLHFRQRRGSCPLSVREPFSLSPANVVEEGPDTFGHAMSNEEQHLLDYENVEAITQSRSLSGSEASVKSRDQEGFFAVCWQNFMVWIYILFAKLFGQLSNA